MPTQTLGSRPALTESASLSIALPFSFSSLSLLLRVVIPSRPRCLALAGPYRCCVHWVAGGGSRAPAAYHHPTQLPSPARWHSRYNGGGVSPAL